MAASRADRARDAELATSLGGEHDEDQEDEQDAGSDRERAERREQGHELRALLVGELERVALRRSRLETERCERRGEKASDAGRRARAATVRDEDRSDHSRPVEQTLRRCERHQQPLVGGRAALVPDDRAQPDRGRRLSDEDPQRVAGVCRELVGGSRVQVDLVRSQRRERDDLAAARDVAEPVQPGRIAGEQRDARLVLTGGHIDDRHLLVDDRCDPRDRPRAGDRAGDPLRVADREVAGPGGLGVRGERRVDAARRDRLVRATQCGSCRRADRLAHRVARRQRGGDDRGAQHRTGDDQRAAGRTPADVPHAEAEEHPVAQTEHRHDEQGGHESSDDDGEKRRHRDAEDVAHDAGVASIVAGARAIATS